jgi:hypothetical protein
MVMTSYVIPATGLRDRYFGHVEEVRALLALAPRSGRDSWSGHDLRLWIKMIEQVTDTEIDCALTLATAWGAWEGQRVAVAAHVVLVRIAPQTEGLDAARLRRNIESVCSHLRSQLPAAIASRLPRIETARPELSSAVVWAYFFACLSVLLLAIAVTH